jgi:predicted house-cleaning noncanonical NTP pyrophosphatase (MazG superfamily)
VIIKLVRDKIPHLIKKDGKIPEVRIANKETEMPTFLYQKMIEELGEFYKDPCIEEAADMLEVLMGLCYNNGFEWSDVMKKADHKRSTNGAFESGIILMNIEGEE